MTCYNIEKWHKKFPHAGFKNRWSFHFDKCIECEGHFDEAQCAAVCPVDAPVPDPDHPKK